MAYSAFNEEIMERLHHYLIEYRRLDRILVTKPVLPSETLAYNDMFKELAALNMTTDFFHAYAKKAFALLDKIYLTLPDDPAKFFVVDRLLNDLDIFATKKATQNKNFVGVFCNNSLFLNMSGFWREGNTDGIDFGFRSFGLIEPSQGSEVIDMEDEFNKVISGYKPLLGVTKIRIGLFPLAEDALVDLRYTRLVNEQRNRWGFVTEERSPMAQQANLDKILEIIEREKIHIACFPELVFGEQAFEYVRQRALTLNSRMLIIIGGSAHKKQADGEYKNTMPVAVFFNGKELLFNYSKAVPFRTKSWKLLRFEEGELVSRDKVGANFLNPADLPENCNSLLTGKLAEDIQTDPAFKILFFRELGALGFLICKDAIITDNPKLASYYKLVDHLFIVSLNPSSKAGFYGRMVNISREFRIGSFYVNALSYDTTLKSASFWQTQTGQTALMQDTKVTTLEKIHKRGEDFIGCELDIPLIRQYFD